MTLPTWVGHLRFGVDLAVTFCGWCGGLALGVSLAVVLFDVIGRSFGHPIAGSPDLVQMSFVALVFGSVPACERASGNVRLDLLAPLFSARLNLWFDRLALALGLVLFALIGWKVWEAAQISKMLKLGTNVLHLPKAPFQISITVACGIVALSILVSLIESFGQEPRA
ncbi:TRAP transporter small permease [Arenibacterium sp. LLYu02]|uniref:TRAP transporter small permease n=1 Tax=Arenibacterium sp. LLYu02 TaxID=3404132 RepID=UPI003B21F1E7